MIKLRIIEDEPKNNGAQLDLLRIGNKNHDGEGDIMREDKPPKDLIGEFPIQFTHGLSNMPPLSGRPLAASMRG